MCIGQRRPHVGQIMVGNSALAHNAFEFQVQAKQYSAEVIVQIGGEVSVFIDTALPFGLLLGQLNL
ncbi:hypothetical protein AWR27_14275 [Spirosoma montaniterrae]|uniref:Uncharacterized protein n=1 Tax=Spirosoma montaniterrae TaxID=1178516 RepID=A0A1P9WYD0_9BACT|nr:hypothetical protein AWR27_14275 [Spirosoma montaniterrae]